jgi:hypothetical protein
MAKKTIKTSDLTFFDSLFEQLKEKGQHWRFLLALLSEQEGMSEPLDSFTHPILGYHNLNRAFAERIGEMSKSGSNYNNWDLYEALGDAWHEIYEFEPKILLNWFTTGRTFHIPRTGNYLVEDERNESEFFDPTDHTDWRAHCFNGEQYIKIGNLFFFIQKGEKSVPQSVIDTLVAADMLHCTRYLKSYEEYVAFTTFEIYPCKMVDAKHQEINMNLSNVCKSIINDINSRFTINSALEEICKESEYMRIECGI